MRIIFLNSWYGKAGEAFFDFIKAQKSFCDIFCFSEVQPELYSDLERNLLNFKGEYLSDGKRELLGYIYGQAVFFKKSFVKINSSKLNLFKQVINDMGNLQYLRLQTGTQTLNVANVHGKARPGHKLDTPARIKQSQKIIDFMKNKKGPRIIGGDFNLMPDTNSVKMFEDAGYKNLIKEFDIKETRNKLTWDQFPNDEKQHFADYLFVSKDVKVKNFQVPKVLISDHLPLILDFDI